MAMAGMHPMMMDAASMFLAHTGELQLTDAQVTRLAAIARRAEAREKACARAWILRCNDARARRKRPTMGCLLRSSQW